MPDVTLAIMDDNPLARAEIHTILNESHPTRNPKILWESESLDDTILKLEMLRPDILIISVQSCDDTLVQFVKIISQRFPDIRKLLVATAPDSPEKCYRVLRAGIDGYILNDESPSIAHAISALLHDSYWFSKRAVEKLVGTPSIIQSIKHSHPHVKLTAREQEVLRLIAMGHSNLQISASLGIKERTVRYHLRHAYDKLGVDSRYQAIVHILNEHPI